MRLLQVWWMFAAMDAGKVYNTLESSSTDAKELR
jgi:hypothetical protein